MTNSKLISTIIRQIVEITDDYVLAAKISSLVCALHEDVRENAIALLSGDAELSVRDISQVVATSNNKNISDLMISKVESVNLLKGEVSCEITYTQVKSVWYKTEEDAEKNQNSRSYEADGYTIKRIKPSVENRIITVALRDWNTGEIVYN